MYTVTQFANHFGITRQRVLFLITHGKIKAEKIGNVYLISELKRAGDAKARKKKAR